jgi:hypothetical protein
MADPVKVVVDCSVAPEITDGMLLPAELEDIYEALDTALCEYIVTSDLSPSTVDRVEVLADRLSSRLG